jgi:hypothetical protein
VVGSVLEVVQVPVEAWAEVGTVQTPVVGSVREVVQVPAEAWTAA